MATILPGLVESTHLFTMLFGHETTCVRRREPLPVKESAVVAVYHDNEGAIKRLLVCDLAFANSAGAALSAIPPTTANGATKSGEIPENILLNLSEVMNVAVNLFTETFGGRLELQGMLRQTELPPEAVQALTGTQRLKIDVAIPRYHLGRVDLIAV